MPPQTKITHTRDRNPPLPSVWRCFRRHLQLNHQEVKEQKKKQNRMQWRGQRHTVSVSGHHSPSRAIGVWKHVACKWGKRLLTTIFVDFTCTQTTDAAAVGLKRRFDNETMDFTLAKTNWPEIQAGIHGVIKGQHAGALQGAFFHRNKAYKEADRKTMPVNEPRR